jgi:alkylated DNA repair dioxygenase AlkB
MDLFSNDSNNIINLLPYDGVANYHGKILKQTEAAAYFDCLLKTIEWQHDEIVIYGKRIITKREVAWYGDGPYLYTYSNTTKQARIFTKELWELKKIIEDASGATFNSCLLNLYHSGEEGMSWHSDDEACFGHNATIASLSLGAERKFSFKHKKTKQTASVLLENGSLLVMKDATQTNWLHSLPKSVTVGKARINLTFRKIISVG